MHYGYFGFGIGLFWILFVAFIVWLLCKKNEGSLALLKKRLAAGEISEREFDRLKRKIE